MLRFNVRISDLKVYKIQTRSYCSKSNFKYLHSTPFGKINSKAIYESCFLAVATAAIAAAAAAAAAALT